MKFYTYEIKSPVLKPFIEFILFNYCNDAAYNSTITYYPNNDICLGIIHGKQMVNADNEFVLHNSSKTINSYLTGIYDKPHILNVSGTFDEICLPFTPLGYYHFFRIPLKQYILQEDVLEEAFGISSSAFFEEVFENESFQNRGQLIELFLLEKMKAFEDNFIKLSLHYLQKSNGDIQLKELTGKLQCSEKKLQRAFKKQFDIMPKEYARILMFRQALNFIAKEDATTLTNIGYEIGYYDQSHFIRNIKSYTGKSPRELRKSLQNLDQKVLLSFS